MKQYQKTIYVCDICEHEFESKDSCTKCESRPLSQDKGVKIGDIVRITDGDGRGKFAKVKRILTHPYSWGGERYWHTISLEADTIDYFGTRLLTFDSYEVI